MLHVGVSLLHAICTTAFDRCEMPDDTSVNLVSVASSLRSPTLAVRAKVDCEFPSSPSKCDWWHKAHLPFARILESTHQSIHVLAMAILFFAPIVAGWAVGRPAGGSSTVPGSATLSFVRAESVDSFGFGFICIGIGIGSNAGLLGHACTHNQFGIRANCWGKDFTISDILECFYRFVDFLIQQVQILSTLIC